MKGNLLSAFMMVSCFEVSGMSCGNCVSKIKEKLDSFSGIKRTEVSLTEESMKIHSEKAPDTKKVLEALKELGYSGKSVPCASSL